MAGEFGTPQIRRPIRQSLLRPAAVSVERDGVVIKRQSFGPIAGLNFAERQVPAKMAMEKPEAYDIINLVADLVALVQALGEDRAFLVGHDWGAIVAAPAVVFAGCCYPRMVAAVDGEEVKFA
jgi:pimeloyl-ACP methyl ester carboxylesterase